MLQTYNFKAIEERQEAEGREQMPWDLEEICILRTEKEELVVGSVTFCCV